ncbi:MAG: hypothetical protein EXS36_20680 [Pedosphaera sp.]|nr:hypothetical protein [Pedosphaera sp.]
MRLLLIFTVCGTLLAGCDSKDRRVPITRAPALAATPTRTVYSPPSVPSTPALTTPAVTLESESVRPNVPSSAPNPTIARTLQVVGTPELPAPVDDVVRLVQSGIGDDVIQGYITGIRQPYSLSADQLIYLRDLGISMSVLEGLVRQSSALAPAPAVAAGISAVTPPVPNAPLPPPPSAAQSVPNVVYAQPQASAAPTSARAPAPMVVTQPAPNNVVDYNYFYESLSPYGSWMNVAPYGWCWLPTVSVVDNGWQPYLHGGNWLWSDAGWYWNSEYSWGWAPFHYGRWHQHHGRGWVWVPGTTWGPSWVTWRTGGGNCGWAPLPPEAYWTAGVGFTYYGSHVSVGFGWGLDPYSYCFVPYSRYCDRHISGHRLPREQNHSIVKDSTIINPVINGNNNTVIINNGLDHREVQKHTGEEIRKTSLKDAASPAGTTRSATGGQRPSSLAVYRPNLPTQAAEPPAHIVQRQEVRKSTPVPNLTSAAPPSRGQSSGITPNSGAPTGSVLAPSRRLDPTTRPSTPAPTRSSEAPRPNARPAPGATPTAGNPPRSIQRPAPNVNQTASTIRQEAVPRPSPPSPVSRLSNPTANPPASNFQPQPRVTSEVPRVDTRQQPTVNYRSEPARGEVRKFESPSGIQSYSAPVRAPAPVTQFQPRPAVPSAPPQRFEQRSVPAPAYRTESAPAPRISSPSPTYQSAPPPARAYTPPPAPQNRPAPARNESAPSRPSGNENGSGKGNREK